MKTFKSFSLLVVLCLVFVSTIWAQEPLTLKIYATDGLKNDSLLVGLDATATNGIDNLLGEYELPPEPPTFDIRSKTYPGYSSVAQGVRTDYHKLNRPTQTDIWKIGFISDEGGAEVTFSWDNTGLGASGGYWMLTELDGTPLCDLTTHTQYTYHYFDVSAQHMLLWRGDGAGFFTAPSESLAYAKDLKGKNSKGKYIAKKANGSEGLFTLTYTGLDSINDLHIVFTKEVDEILSVTPAAIATPTLDKKNKEWDFNFSPSWLRSTDPVTIFARTHKGKGKALELHVKKYWWTVNGKQWLNRKEDAKAFGVAPVFATGEKAVLPYPNLYNLVDQVYQVKYPKDAKLNGICVGTTAAIGADAKGPLYKFISHPKSAELSKSLYNGAKSGPQSHVGSGSASSCLAVDAKGNPLKSKVYKTYAPKGLQFNPLFAELLALKTNVEINDGGWTGASNAGLLKTLMIAPQPTDCTWMPISVDSLIKVADWYMSACAKRASDPTGANAGWLYSTISRINAAFAGVLDTQSWWPNGAIAKPVRNLAQTTVLYRNAWSAPEPVNYGFAFRETEPFRVKLDQNYPNPFNPTTTIAFELPEDAMVTLKIYNLLGQEVATLINQEEFTEGTNEVPFDASRFASGVYYYRLIVNDGQFQQVKKMMLLK